jgi:hypothetical protein
MSHRGEGELVLVEQLYGNGSRKMVAYHLRWKDGKAIVSEHPNELDKMVAPGKNYQVLERAIELRADGMLFTSDLYARGSYAGTNVYVAPTSVILECIAGHISPQQLRKSAQRLAKAESVRKHLDELRSDNRALREQIASLERELSRKERMLECTGAISVARQEPVRRWWQFWRT